MEFALVRGNPDEIYGSLLPRRALEIRPNGRQMSQSSDPVIAHPKANTYGGKNARALHASEWLDRKCDFQPMRHLFWQATGAP